MSQLLLFGLIYFGIYFVYIERLVYKQDIDVFIHDCWFISVAIKFFFFDFLFSFYLLCVILV